MLNDKANPAGEITALRSRIVTLESDNAALTKDKEDAWELIEEFRHENSEQRCQLAAAQATNAKLRKDMESAYALSNQLEVLDTLNKALALPNDTTALDARLAQERKEIADTCDRFHERGMTPAECAAHIRSMT